MTGQHVHGAGQLAGILHMGAMGALVALLAPALVMALRGSRCDPDLCAPPWWLAGPGFVAVHAVITLAVPAPPLLAAVIVLIGAMVFWAPVLGRRHRLPDPGRAVYLFIAGPTLDLPGVWLVARGAVGPGLAMIVGMLPVGLAAVVVTWRWVTAEERAARALEAGAAERGVLPTR